MPFAPPERQLKPKSHDIGSVYAQPKTDASVYVVERKLPDAWCDDSEIRKERCEHLSPKTLTNIDLHKRSHLIPKAKALERSQRGRGFVAADNGFFKTAKVVGTS